ncbi:MAG: sigma-70 region 4 domain-containing protein [Dehalococcoidia bacterium]|nr:sigma-70 region 4 domain-containing protein [Dehalococcoidia bacterium]
MRMTAEDLERVCELAALPEEQRAVLRLLNVGERNDAEIAAALGIEEGTVRTRIHRAKAAIHASQHWHELRAELVALVRAPDYEERLICADDGEGLSVREEASTLIESIRGTNCNPRTPIFDSDNPRWAREVAVHGTAWGLPDVEAVVLRRRWQRRQAGRHE